MVRVRVVWLVLPGRRGRATGVSVTRVRFNDRISISVASAVLGFWRAPSLTAWLPHPLEVVEFHDPCVVPAR